MASPNELRVFISSTFRDLSATPHEFIDTDEESSARLLRLKDRIRRSGLPLKENFASATGTSPVLLPLAHSL